MTTDQALILAGGRGTRLGDLTRDLPKPMIPVNGKPFLEHLLLHLKAQGIRRFVLTTGYKAEKIREHFQDGRAWDCEIVYSEEKEPLGTGGAIKQASSLLAENFLVASGDNFLDFNYRDFLGKFTASNMLGLLACWKIEPGFQGNLLLEESTGRVLDYAYQNPAGKNYLDSGIKVFSKKLLTYFPDREVFSLEADVMEKLAKKGLLAGYPIVYPPLDVGTPENLEIVRKSLSAK